MNADQQPSRELISKPLTTIEEAKELLTYLFTNDFYFNPEDDAASWIDDFGDKMFTQETADILNERAAELWNFDWGTYECPCGFVLSLHERAGN